MSARLARFCVLNGIGLAGVAALAAAGLLQLPFEGHNAYLSGPILAVLVLGLWFVARGRLDDAVFIAKQVVRLGLLVCVLGLITAFYNAVSTYAADPSDLRVVFVGIVHGMFIALFGTLLGVASNVWLRVNLWLIARVYE